MVLLLLLLFFLALAWTGLVTTLSLWKVDLHVPGNVTLCLETLLTNITLKLSQASVSKDVFIEITTSVESFPTLITLIIPNTLVLFPFILGLQQGMGQPNKMPNIHPLFRDSIQEPFSKFW